MAQKIRDNLNFLLIESILDRLFGNEEKHIQLQINNLTKMHREITGDDVDGFLYQGEFYRWMDSPMKGQAKKNLHPTLHSKMQILLEESFAILKERQQIRQGLVKLLRPCHSLQDIRDALPNSIADTVDEVSVLERTREPLWTIKDDERSMRQIQPILKKIEFYSASRLFL